MTLSLTGDFGFDFIFGEKTVLGSDIDIFNFDFYIGPKVSFTYKILEHFGVFANVGVFYAGGLTSVSTSYTYSDKYGSYSSTDSDGWSNTGVIFRPEFGVAIPL